MAGIPDSTIQEIRDRADIVQVIESYVPLKRRGQEMWGCCPFHNEKSPSFKVSQRHQAYHCFGCQKSGDVFRFIMERENVDFVGAIRLLAQRFNIEIPERDPAGPGSGAVQRQFKDRLFELLKTVAGWYQQVLLNHPDAEPVRAYLRDRGVPDDSIRKFGLGYAPNSWDATLEWGKRQGYDASILGAAGLVVPREGTDGFYDRFRGRLMFPIWDETGRVTGFSGRILEKDAKAAKYVNSPETEVFKKSRILYALHLARAAFKEHGFALICEGQLDVIACHRAGMTNAVAPQGTAFTEEHARLLRRFTEDVAFCFDADEAGQKATLAGVELAISHGLRPKVVTLPGEGGKEDPDSLLKKHGAEFLAGVLKGGIDPLEHVLAVGRSRFPAVTPEGKSRITDLALPVIARYPSPITRAGYAQWLAGQLGLPESAVLAGLQALMNQQQRQDLGRRAAAPPPPEGEAAAMAARPAPPVVPDTLTQRTLGVLLDVCLHHEPSAKEVNARIPHDLLGTSPLGRALGMLLALSAEGEWDGASRHLLEDTELTADGAVMKLLVSNDYAPPEEGADAETKARFATKAVKAREDCLRRLEQEEISRELTELRARLAQEPDPVAQQQYLVRNNELLRRRHELQRAASAVPPPPARPT